MDLFIIKLSITSTLVTWIRATYGPIGALLPNMVSEAGFEPTHPNRYIHQQGYLVD